MSDVYVSLGSNIDKERNTLSGLAALRARFGDLLTSAVYESRAVGFEGDNFFNLVAGFSSEESVEAIAAALHDIEARHGRLHNGPRHLARTLDLDLLLYGDQVISAPGLSLPREDIVKYAFVLCPLAEIAGHLRHPLSGLSFDELWASFDAAAQPLRRVMTASLSPVM